MFLLGLWLFAGCVAQQHKYLWRVKDMALGQGQVVDLYTQGKRLMD